MELTNTFAVRVPVDVAWRVLTDVERIAPCLPGARLDRVEGEDFHGAVRVRVGPVTAEYRGRAHFLERDEAAGRAVLRAEGRDSRGQGTANATITATLVPSGEVTEVRVVTDLTVTGRVAQFGRGALSEVSAKLLGQFVACLEETVLASEAGPARPSEAAGSSEATSSQVTSSEATSSAATDAGGEGVGPTAGPVAEAGRSAGRPPTEPEAIDLIGVAGGAILRRALPVLVVLGALAVLWWRRRR
jgi:carbon monoxide dehydrogenase subunit G